VSKEREKTWRSASNAFSHEENRRARLDAFFERFSELVRPVDLKTVSTMGVGDFGMVATVPDLEKLRELVLFCRTIELAWLPLGGASNCLFPDGILGAVLVRLGEPFEEISLEDGLVVCGAGASAAKLLNFSLANDLGGLEILAGLPGTVGGALAGNAGAKDAGLADLAAEIEAVGTDGLPRTLRRGEFKSGYRFLGLPPELEGSVVTRCRLELPRARREETSSKVAELLAARRRSQPMGARSLGCVFKNPPGRSAGELIDLCGLKGREVGGARISPVHANFIVNLGGASSKDVLELAGLARESVLKTHGVVLSLEIKALDRRGRLLFW
jgi:UDP-N-acetylmuramate dehydrogenase